MYSWDAVKFYDKAHWPFSVEGLWKHSPQVCLHKLPLYEQVQVIATLFYVPIGQKL